MSLNKISRIGAASVLSLAACLGFTSCSRDYTVGFVYVTSAKGNPTNQHGFVNEYGIDYQTGALLTLPSSGQDSGGRNPSGLIITPDQRNVFVINHDDSNIVNFKIGTDGKLYPDTTTNIAGSFPTALGISGDGKFLYVTFGFQPGYTTANAGPGGVEVFPLTYDSSSYAKLGTPVANGSLNYFPLGYNPAGIAVGPNLSTVTPGQINPSDCVAQKCVSYVYVIDQDGNTYNNLLAFSRDYASGAITPIGSTSVGPGQTSSTGYLSGVLASAVAVAPTGNFLYVADKNSNNIIGYSMTGNGIPTPITSGPYPTGSQPVALTIDPRGKFLYAANYNSNSVTSYVINPGIGSLTATASGTQTTGSGPTCVAIENALGIYLYTSNALDNTVSGLQLNAATGVLTNIRNTPFNAAALPSCVAATANASQSHSQQIVQQ